MATMIEKKAESIKKEIAKYEVRLAKHEAKLEKAYAKAKEMDAVEFKPEWNTTNPENPMYRLPEYIPFVHAYMELFGERREVEDLKGAIERAKARLAKLMPTVNEIKAAEKEAEYIAEVECKVLKAKTMTPEEYEEWLKQFKADCLKDGIVIEDYRGCAIWGKSKSGKNFFLQINSGYTERSLHCYTLTIDRETIFTSGTFDTAYRYLKK